MKKSDIPLEIVRIARRSARTTGPDAFEALIAAMEALPPYRNWLFLCEFPGLFCFRHPDNRFSVFCTPDWGEDETLPIHVHLDDGTLLEDADLNQQLPLPREGRTAEKILGLVRPTLDKLLTMPGQPRARASSTRTLDDILNDAPSISPDGKHMTIGSYDGGFAFEPLGSLPRKDAPSAPAETEQPLGILHLNAPQIEGLRKAREHVRVNMSLEHGWTVRDEALGAIDRALLAADLADVLCLRDRQVKALRKAREHVRVNMIQHGWTVRDEALGAFDLVLLAASKVSS